jgi:hypothetical protein
MILFDFKMHWSYHTFVLIFDYLLIGFHIFQKSFLLNFDCFVNIRKFGFLFVKDKN